MKAILKSLFVIGMVSVVAIGATRAFFSDSETSVGNTFSTGTIDIAVDDENPWNATDQYTFEDVKPSQVREMEFIITNVGGNPARVWKRVDVVSTEDNGVNEPECDAYSGTWDGSICSDETEKNDIDTVIEYDLYVNDNSIIHEDYGITIAEIQSLYIDLGTLDPDETMTVKQSYHMKADTGNWAQSDKMTFNIEIYAEQLLGTGPGPTDRGVVLENKSGDEWSPVIDNRWGLLTFNSSGSTFDYTFKGYALEAGTEYSLIYYADPWPGNNPGALIGTMTTNSNGDIVHSDSLDLSMDLPDPGDDNYPTGAKIWLVPSTDYDSGSKSLTAWNLADYLLETTLMTYDDSDF